MAHLNNADIRGMRTRLLQSIHE